MVLIFLKDDTILYLYKYAKINQWGILSEQKKKKIKSTILIMCLFFVLIVCAFIIEIVLTDNFNKTERTLFGDGELCNVAINPRGGTTDSWAKIIDGREDYVGVIYEGIITNSGQYDMSKWTLRINIEDDVYINNAWCGKVEIHQMNEGKELVQVIDLRDYSEPEILLNHQLADTDLLIPLHKGDYIVYIPNQEVDEFPILGTGLYGGNQGNVSIGLILYYEKGQEINLSNIDFKYYLHKQLKQDPFFTITLICGIIWSLSVIVFVAVELNTC